MVQRTFGISSTAVKLGNDSHIPNDYSLRMKIGRYFLNPKLVLTISIVATFLVLTMVPTSSAQSVSINLGTVPTSATPREKLTMTWEIAGTGKIAHTAVHWDIKPGNPADFKSYPKATPEFAAISPPQDGPRKYTVSIDAPASGTVYYVVHAIVDGKNVYAPGGERTITVGEDAAMKAKEDAAMKAKEGSRIYGIDNTTIMLGLGGVIVIVAVVAVALTRRKPKAA